MSVMGLTSHQSELLNFIRSRLSHCEIAPSFDEMKDAVGLKSKSGIHRIIVALERKGSIRRLPGMARAIQLVDQSDEYERGYAAGFAAASRKTFK